MPDKYVIMPSGIVARIIEVKRGAKKVKVQPAMTRAFVVETKKLRPSNRAEFEKTFQF